MTEWTLAIDFGTSYTSAAAAGPDQRPEPIELQGDRRMPSLVLLSKTGTLVVGKSAERQAALFPDRVERTPKRNLSSGTPLVLGEVEVSPVDSVAAVLRAVVSEARRVHDNSRPSRVRLTHPARWGPDDLAALRDAAIAAGIEEPELIPEPVAAALHFATETISAGEHVAVYDLGGGTFDTAVLRRTPTGFALAGPPGGNEHFGGEDFDDLLLAHLGQRIARDDPQAWAALRGNARATRDFRMQIRDSKESLSEELSTFVVVPGSDLDPEVTREDFEDLIRSAVQNTVAELTDTITKAGVGLADLAAVYVVGGSSRIPLVGRLLGQHFPITPLNVEPKLVTSLGAARLIQLEPSTCATRPPPPTPPLMPEPDRWCSRLTILPSSKESFFTGAHMVWIKHAHKSGSMVLTKLGTRGQLVMRIDVEPASGPKVREQIRRDPEHHYRRTYAGQGGTLLGVHTLPIHGNGVAYDLAFRDRTEQEQHTITFLGASCSIHMTLPQTTDHTTAGDVQAIVNSVLMDPELDRSDLNLPVRLRPKPRLPPGWKLKEETLKRQARVGDAPDPRPTWVIALSSHLDNAAVPLRDIMALEQHGMRTQGWKLVSEGQSQVFRQTGHVSFYRNEYAIRRSAHVVVDGRHYSLACETPTPYSHAPREKTPQKADREAMNWLEDYAALATLDDIALRPRAAPAQTTGSPDHQSGSVSGGAGNGSDLNNFLSGKIDSAFQEVARHE